MNSTILRIIAFVLLSFSIHTSFGQTRLLEEVKKDVSALNLSVKDYTKALQKLGPALTDTVTKSKAESWYVAGKISFKLYDRSIQNASVGEAVDKVSMAKSLIVGYNYFDRALKLDTVILRDKKGRPRMNKRTGKPRFKVKYSHEIYDILVDHIVDFSAAGGDLFMAGNFTDSYTAWDIYCQLAGSDHAKRRKHVESDSIIGYYRFFQGLAATQLKEYQAADSCFTTAMALGYKNKDLYDSWIDVAIKQRDTLKIVSLAHAALEQFGKQDSQYLRILINQYLAKRDFATASRLLDNALLRDSLSAEYQDLKGQLVEQQSGPVKAYPYYEKAVRLQPNFERALKNLGFCLYKQALELNDMRSAQAKELFQKALPHLERVYELNPQSQDTRKVLSHIYYIIGSNKIDEIGK